MAISNPLSSQLMRATLAKLEASRQEALAHIELYLNVPVGVGDHSSIVDELVAATTQLASAEESLAVLQRTFLETPPDVEVNE
tara:strand:+ start:1579 stop:1827 length:249 start_codon:yes stop_codon:yes gene_type:complete